MAASTLQTAIGNYGHTKPIIEKAIKPESADIEWVEVSPIINAFRRMVRGLEFDVSEMAISTYLCAKAHNKPFTALPVFVVRGFHHGAISYNVNSGIKEPKDLEGRKVGVRGYTVTTGVWVRGILQTGYGVDLNKVTWVLSGDEHVAEYQAPSNVVPAPEGKDLATLLTSGEIDAAIGVGRLESPDVKPLIPDAGAAAAQYYKDHGVYPINHTIVVKDELLAANPGLAVDLYNMFKAAKKQYMDFLDAGSGLAQADETMLQSAKTLGGDPLPYGVAANRKTVEAIIQHCVDQKVIPQSMAPEAIFAEGTQDLN